MDNEKWEELYLRALSIICVSLVKKFLGMSSGKELWEKLEGMYQGTDVSNCLLLKEQFHSLCMDEHVKVSENLSVMVLFLN